MVLILPAIEQGEKWTTAPNQQILAVLAQVIRNTMRWLIVEFFTHVEILDLGPGD